MSHPARTILLVAVCVAVAGFLALVGVASMNASRWVENYNVPPKLRAGYQEWKTKVIHLPPEALDPKPFAPETVAAAEAFNKAWERDWRPLLLWLDTLTTPATGLSRVSLGPDALDYASVDEHLRQFQPLLDALETLVSRPDYETQAESPEQHYDKESLEGILPPFPNGQAIQGTASLWSLEAFSLARRGNWAEADRRIQLVFRASRNNPYDMPVASFPGVALREFGAGTWSQIVARCDDAALLRRMLDEQNGLAAHPFCFPEGVQSRAFDLIGEMRGFKRAGVPGDFQDMTGEELESRWHAMRAEFIRLKVLPNITGDAAATEKANQQIAWNERMADDLDPNSPDARMGFGTLFRLALRCQIYKIEMVYDDRWIRNLASAPNEKLDLLRLATARKLFRLEKGHEAADAKELVPEYLPALPMDAFAAPPAPLRVKDGRDYSVGPDGRDDGGAIAYDPTNGAISPGDLTIKF